MTGERRRRAVSAALPDDVDALLVTNLMNVRYLTGFTGSNGALLSPQGGLRISVRDLAKVGREANCCPRLGAKWGIVG